jgi:hypothetical protein
VGNFNEVDVAVVAAPSKNNRFELGLAYVRSQFVFGRFTSDVMALRFQKNAMLGFSCAGAVGDVGVWGDAAATLVGAFGKTPYENQTQKDEPNYQRFTVGVDSKWGEKLTLQGEYGFNGAGKWAVSDYALLPTTTPYTHGRVFLVGRHYVGVQGTYETENRWSPSLKSVLNVMDFSGMVSPAVIFDATNSYDFAAGANISFGKKSETTSLGMPALRSEYGSVPRIFYAQTRVTF